MMCIVLIMIFNRNLVMTPTRPNTLSSNVKVYKKNIITNKYQHDAYYCTYDTNSSQPMREWFKLGFVYSIHNTNMVKIVWVRRIGASFPQYITIAIIFCAMGVVTIALYPPSALIPWIQIDGGNLLFFLDLHPGGTKEGYTDRYVFELNCPHQHWLRGRRCKLPTDKI